MGTRVVGRALKRSHDVLQEKNSACEIDLGGITYFLFYLAVYILLYTFSSGYLCQ